MSQGIGGANAAPVTQNIRSGILGRIIVRTAPRYHEKRLQDTGDVIHITAKAADNIREIAAQEYPVTHERGFFEPLRRMAIAGYSVLAGGFCSLLNPKRTFHDLFIRDSRMNVNQRKAEKHEKDFQDYSVQKEKDFQDYRFYKNNDIHDIIIQDSNNFDHKNIFINNKYKTEFFLLENTAIKDTNKFYDLQTPLPKLKEKVDNYYKESFEPLYQPYIQLLTAVRGRPCANDKTFQAYEDVKDATNEALKSPHEGIREIAGMIKKQLREELQSYRSPGLTPDDEERIVWRVYQIAKEDRQSS